MDFIKKSYSSLLILLAEAVLGIFMIVKPELLRSVVTILIGVLLILVGAIALVKQHLLFGNGRLFAVDAQRIYGLPAAINAHNMWLEILVEGGVLTLVIFILSLLLTGDLEEEGEGMALEELRARGIAYVDILKCAHHGSRFATSGEFLDWVDGEVSVISCGRRNRYGHPAPETLERLLQDGFQVFRTDQGGAILMKWDGKKLRVHPFLGILDKNAE